MKVKIINSLYEVFTEEGQDNDYSKFENFKGKGVYIFRNKETEKVIYIGEGQNISERLKQHFKRGDTGGTLKNNILSKKNSDISDKDWQYYKNIISQCQILIIEGSDIDRKKFEDKLINFLEPKYNK